MTTLAEFMRFTRELDADAYSILNVANEEYAAEGDKFENFKTICAYLREVNPRLIDLQPEDIALVYFMKHLSSIMKGVSKREDMRGRYIDAMNYLRLHYGIVRESSGEAREVPMWTPSDKTVAEATAEVAGDSVVAGADVRTADGNEDFRPGSGGIPVTPGVNPWK